MGQRLFQGPAGPAADGWRHRAGNAGGAHRAAGALGCPRATFRRRCRRLCAGAAAVWRHRRTADGDPLVLARPLVRRRRFALGPAGAAVASRAAGLPAGRAARLARLAFPGRAGLAGAAALFRKHFVAGGDARAAGPSFRAGLGRRGAGATARQSERLFRGAGSLDFVGDAGASLVPAQASQSGGPGFAIRDRSRMASAAASSRKRAFFRDPARPRRGPAAPAPEAVAPEGYSFLNEGRSAPTPGVPAAPAPPPEASLVREPRAAGIPRPARRSGSRFQRCARSVRCACGQARLPDPANESAWPSAGLARQWRDDAKAALGDRPALAFLREREFQHPPRRAYVGGARHRRLRGRARQGAALHQRRLAAGHRLRARRDGGDQSRRAILGPSLCERGRRDRRHLARTSRQYRAVAAIGRRQRREIARRPGRRQWRRAARRI